MPARERTTGAQLAGHLLSLCQPALHTDGPSVTRVHTTIGELLLAVQHRALFTAEGAELRVLPSLMPACIVQLHNDSGYRSRKNESLEGTSLISEQPEVSTRITESKLLFVRLPNFCYKLSF